MIHRKLVLEVSGIWMTSRWGTFRAVFFEALKDFGRWVVEGREIEGSIFLNSWMEIL
jgi:hypothetical protein